MPMLFPSRGFRRTRERASGLLFAFGVDDLSTSLVTGQTLTFDRDSGRTVIDSTGRMVALAYDQVPWAAQYNSTAAAYEPVVECMADSANYCLRSEDFGTTWVAIGTPTRTAAARTCGVMSLDLIGDDAAGTLEGYSQALTPSGGNGTKGVMIHLAAGTSTSTVIRVRDTTASANRLLATVTWSGGVPTVTMTTGTHLGTVACANGVYQLLFQSTTWTVANTTQVEVYPATTSALVTTNTGTVYAGGVGVEKHVYPRGYVRTTSAAVVEDDDLLTSTIGWAPQDFTLYLRMARPAWADSAIPAGSTDVYAYSVSGAAGAFSLRYSLSSSQWIATITDGTTPRTATASMPAGSIVEIAMQCQSFSTGATVRMDVGAGYGSASSATGVFSAWGGSTLNIGSGGTLTQLDAGLRRLIIAPGARTLSQMRGLAV